MKLQPGDKVKFLSETGGGVVTRIISDKLVAVAIEDGFEIPTAINNLIKEETQESSSKSTASKNTASSSDASTFSATQTGTRLQNSNFYENPGEGIFLSFVPQDQLMLISGTLDIEIVNRTPFELIYSLYLKSEDGLFKGQDYGSVEAFSKLCIASISREEIEKWNKGILQAVLHSDKPAFIPSPLNSSFTIKAMRFFKEDNYRNYNFSRERSFLFNLSSLSMLKTGAEQETSVAFSKSEVVKVSSLISRHLQQDHTAVVDLHIESLNEDYKRLQPAEILNIQLSYFSRILQSAIAEKISKVVFIHGVGQGILKSEIRKALEAYDFITYYDAPMAEYGTGATEARIFQS